MAEKRKFQRYQCFLKVNFDYFEGNPDEIDMETMVPVKADGHMLDISKGGAFIVSDTRVSINMPVRLKFEIKNRKHEVPAFIVRTGLLKNNPSELARKYAAVKVKEDAYIALKFDSLLENISEKDLT